MDKTCSLISVTALLLHYVVACLANIAIDQAALLALKSHLSLSLDSTLATNWSSTATSVCSWIGVTCGSRHHRVTALDISGLQLTGTIPPHLGNLSFLTSLDMSNNSFYGNVPGELGHLRRLKLLDLTRNNFSGPVPAFFNLLQKLRVLHLSRNRFSGTIPSSLSNVSRLEELAVNRNNLEGNITLEFANLRRLTFLNLEFNRLTGPIPPAIFNISSLQIIGLSRNDLSGKLPVDICHHLPNLERLYLSGNSLDGQIPSSLEKCSLLQFLSLSANDFSGTIPKEIGNLTMLEVLHLGGTYLQGKIPEEIGNLQKLLVFGVNWDDLSGPIPASLFNISTLDTLAMTGNRLSGNLPSSLGHGVPNLREIYLAMNNFTGVIPDSISNASQLTLIDLSNNNFSGPIPHSLGNLGLLRVLNLENNNFQHESSSSELSFLTSLTKCRNLRELVIARNPLSGVLPSSIGNFSKSLNIFAAYGSKLKGKIPEEIGKLSNLTFLGLSDNELTSPIPTTIKGLEGLQEFYIDNNYIIGPVPNGFCHLKNLGALGLSGNDIYGPIPECLGNITSLRHLYLASNRLSSLPASLWNLRDLLTLNASSNRLSGRLPPEIGSLDAVIVLDLSINTFSGNIPSTIGGLQNLINLTFAHNRLEGPIPESFGKLVSLEILDVSYNNITGLIPKSLEDLIYLSQFNVSFNKLSGEIPSGGPFLNFTGQSFMSNGALCGASRFQVPPCQNSPRRRRQRVYVTLLIICGIVGMILASILGYLFIRWQKKKKAPSQLDSLIVTERERISYYELEQATNGFSESNLLGKGSFGTVYRGLLGDGTVVAVKVFDTQLEGASKSFDTECEALRNLRHRNLAKVITSCSNAADFKSLVLEYMPNGSLEKWLYSHNHFLNILQRLDIMIDVASALDYLHNGFLTPLVHCDLKPSNVVLDEDFVGHVCDFGIAKLLGGENSVAYTKTLATIGYIAPEYGQEGLVSIKCDIYSFGIMLMEIFTRMKPSDDMFVEELSLRSWISDSIPHSIIHVVDANLLRPEEQNLDERMQCLISVMELALHCTAALPDERLDVKDVVAALKKIRTQLFTSSGGP